MRIIAGSARGRSFDAPAGRDTRPTLDRVKEAIFGSVQFQVPGATVLDLFSGSGNMGLEALSRGAAKAVCVDGSPVCAALIRRNGEKLGLSEGLQVVNADFRAALSAMKARGEQADLVFLDPPYASGFAAEAVKTLFEEDLLARGGVVIVEHAWEQPPELGEGPWAVSRVKKYGACGVTTLTWRERE
ncbi:MAG: 16S rRNA (guanine(966)-N(2))-methyltransferase RsmD [Clostridia bacterium]|nr:16S rRNA (guanine(966)-N(2))-methyltransferase RsmD [Clostridia bacterium]